MRRRQVSPEYGAMPCWPKATWQGRRSAIARRHGSTLMIPHKFSDLGFALYELGQDGHAQVMLQRAILLDPLNPDAPYLMGATFRLSGELGLAIDHFTQAIGLRRDFAQCRRDLYVSLLEAGHNEAAKASIVEGISLHPESPSFHHYLGIVSRQEERLDDAVASFESALALSPDFAEAHVNLGMAYQAQGKIDSAMKCYEAAISLRPDYAEAHNNLGIALDVKRDLEGALRCYERALAAQPDFAEALGNLGNVQQKLGLPTDAIQTYQRALVLNPRLATLHSGLGVALQATGQLEAAVASFEAAIRLQSDFAEAHSNLGTVIRGSLGKSVCCGPMS